MASSYIDMNTVQLFVERNGNWAEVYRLNDSIFSRMIGDPQKIYYCPTCDEMVRLSSVSFFKPEPWRTDVFKWKEK